MLTIFNCNGPENATAISSKTCEITVQGSLPVSFNLKDYSIMLLAKNMYLYHISIQILQLKFQQQINGNVNELSTL